MKHYLITYKNNKIADIKLICENVQEAKKNALWWGRHSYPKTHVMIKDIWLCTKIS